MWEHARGAALACACWIAAAVAGPATAQTVLYRVTSDWGSGFQAEIEITNSGSAPVYGWIVEFELPRQISSIWNARILSRSGSRYAITGEHWNPDLPAAGSVSFGFVAIAGGAVVPATFTVRSGGGATPTPSAAQTSTATRTRTRTRTPAATSTRTATALVATATRTIAPASATPTRPPASPTATTTRTASPTATRSPAAPTATSTRPPASLTFTPTATPTGAVVRVSFARTSVWDGGYNAEIRITNTAPTAVSGWTLGFTLNDTITALWNGRLDPGGPPAYVVRHESWTGTIASGASVAIGFGAAAAGAFATPSACVFNGIPCVFEAAPPPAPTVGAGEAIQIQGVDAPLEPALQLTVGQAITDFPLALAGSAAPAFTATTNNPAVVTAAIVGGTTLRLSAVAAGRAALRISESTSGAVRHVGIRVRTAGGALPGLPDYVAVGSVSEDSETDLALWRGFGSGLENTRIDFRYIYLNGGPFGGWYDWQGGHGARARTYIRLSKTLGQIPVFVFYNIPDAGESYFTDLQHIQSTSYMAAYFDNLAKALEIISTEGGDEVIGIVLEPDFIGYMMQLSGKQPHDIAAMTHAAYDAGLLVAGTDPAFPDTLAGLVSAINYVISRRAPNAVFGWQFNLWASLIDGSGIPATGLMRITDSLGLAAGRARIALEAQRIADYYVAAGVLSHGADFISIDKYGLDGGFGGAAATPWSSTWFWNAVHWNNYLLFTRGLHERTGMPVVLWQIPVGHVNHSLADNPRALSRLFPDLTNTYQRYEDSAPTFFFGDRFDTQGDAQRLAYFGSEDPDHPASVSVAGDVVEWSPHMSAAAAAGVLAILFGDGVGESTHGRGLPPPDGFWWITRTQEYLFDPVP